MCPANCVAPQSIVAGGKRRDVFLHPDTGTSECFLSTQRGSKNRFGSAAAQPLFAASPPNGSWPDAGSVTRSAGPPVTQRRVRQESWQRIGGASPPRGRSSQPPRPRVMHEVLSVRTAVKRSQGRPRAEY